MKYLKAFLLGLLVTGVCSNASGMFFGSWNDSDTKEVEATFKESSSSKQTTTNKQSTNKKPLLSDQESSGFEFSNNGYTFASKVDKQSATKIIGQLKNEQSCNKRFTHFFLVGPDIAKNEVCARKIAQSVYHTPLAINCTNYPLAHLNNLITAAPGNNSIILIISNFGQASDELKERIISLVTIIPLEDTGRFITVAFNNTNHESLFSTISTNNIPYNQKLIIKLKNSHQRERSLAEAHPLEFHEYSFTKQSFNNALAMVQELEGKTPNKVIKPFLLVGPEGIGKKTFVETIAHASNFDYCNYHALAILNKTKKLSHQSIEAHLQDLDDPTICCLEGIDQLNNKNNLSFSKITHDSLWQMITKVNQSNPHIIFVLTALKAKNIFPHSYLKLHGRVTSLGKPVKQQRKQLIKGFLKNINWNVPEATIIDLVQKTVGWTPREIKAIVDGAVKNISIKPLSERLQESYTTIAKALDRNNYVLTTDSLDDLHVSQEIKNDINHIIAIVKNWNRRITPRRSLLMYGPYGVGKTTIAEIIAREADAYFVKKSAASFVRKFVGSGAERIEEAFEELKDIDCPVVFLIDELEGLAPSQDEASQGKGVDEYTKSAQILWGLMDDFAKQYPHVFVIAACNNYEKIHPRIQQTFKISLELCLPTQPERIRIILTQARQLGKTITNELTISIAEQTEGWSGRDLRDMMRIIAEYHENTRTITEQMIQSAFARIKAAKDGSKKLEVIAREKRIEKLTEAAWANWYVQVATLPKRIKEQIEMQKNINYETSGRNAIPLVGGTVSYLADVGWWAQDKTVKGVKKGVQVLKDAVSSSSSE